MKKIFVVVEGSTEERFVHQVLYPHFVVRGILIEAQQWITNRKIGTSGGSNSYSYIENHLKRLMSKYKHDDQVYLTVMVDLYAFPKKGNTIYGKDVEKMKLSTDKVILLNSKMREQFNYMNFIPYVQLHEFETLLLTKPEALNSFYPSKEKEINALIDEIKGLNPEEINETPQGAPSKRIIKYIPSFERQKTTAGVDTAIKIGLPMLRARCPNFNQWITTMENI
jgi:Domain of unknown function (DUF4276)